MHKIPAVKKLMSLNICLCLDEIISKQETESRVAAPIIYEEGGAALISGDFKMCPGKSKAATCSRNPKVRSLSKCLDSGCEWGCHTTNASTTQNSCFLITQINIQKWKCWIIWQSIFSFLRKRHTVSTKPAPIYIPTNGAQVPYSKSL